MKNLTVVLLGLFICFIVLGSATASTITNGGFENGLTGWTIDTTTGGSVTTTSYNGGTAAAAFASSSISQNYSWELGEELAFDWAFDYVDWGTTSPYSDYNYFGVTDTSGNGGSFEITLAQTFDADWQSYLHTFSNAGSGTLYFGSQNVGDEYLDSIAFFDNVSSSTISPVPEPTTMVLLGFGILGLAGVSRRKK